MAETESTSTTDASKRSGDTAAEENRFHTYTGTRIPWYVRLIWILFWVFAVAYVIKYLFPDLQVELLNPP